MTEPAILDPGVVVAVAGCSSLDPEDAFGATSEIAELFHLVYIARLPRKE
jgi:hypothetical protein